MLHNLFSFCSSPTNVLMFTVCTHTCYRVIQKKVPILRLKKKLMGQDDVDATFERQVLMVIYVHVSCIKSLSKLLSDRVSILFFVAK